jgi:hypothetical protein
MKENYKPQRVLGELNEKALKVFRAPGWGQECGLRGRAPA